MSLRAELRLVGQGEAGDRRKLYGELLAATLYVRAPLERRWVVTQPGSDRRALPVFLTPEEGEAYWSALRPGELVRMAALPFMALAEEGRQVGGLLVDPEGASLLLERSELTHLAAGEIPGEFTAWLRGWGRLQDRTPEVMARLRRGHVYVISGRNGEGQRLYLLERSDDGSMAVPCFSSAETLAQFAEVRRLFAEGGRGYAVALVEGEYCLRAASGLGAYLLLDPESPWELQIEPTLL